jgi:toxin ParE1/3/4
MARWRLSAAAQADLATILATSQERWGIDGRRRYATLIVAALRLVADHPEGPGTRDRADLLAGIRSLHLRYARSSAKNEAAAAQPMARRPVHVLYFRSRGSGPIDIVRVLHERMEPSRHLDKDRQED